MASLAISIGNQLSSCKRPVFAFCQASTNLRSSLTALPSLQHGVRCVSAFSRQPNGPGLPSCALSRSDGLGTAFAVAQKQDVLGPYLVACFGKVGRLDDEIMPGLLN